MDCPFCGGRADYSFYMKPDGEGTVEWKVRFYCARCRAETGWFSLFGWSKGKDIDFESLDLRWRKNE